MPCFLLIQPADITIVKSMKNPPAGVKLVMAAVCVMKDIKPEKISDPSGTGGKVITRHRFKSYYCFIIVYHYQIKYQQLAIQERNTVFQIVWTQLTTENSICNYSREHSVRKLWF